MTDITYSRRIRLTGKPILLGIVSIVILSLIFSLFPEIDLAFSQIFYFSDAGFPAQHVRLLQDIRSVGSIVPVVFATIVILTVALKVLYPTRPPILPLRFSVYFSMLFIIGPVILVNGLLKPFWGRPRPIAIHDFGGNAVFVPAWHFGECMFCHRSFVSGEAAAVACLLPLALFVHRQWRGTATMLLASFVLAVSLDRVAFGAHFLSDISISIALMMTIAAALHHFIIQRHPTTFADEALAVRLGQFGTDLRRVPQQGYDALSGHLKKHGISTRHPSDPSALTPEARAALNEKVQLDK